MKEEKKMTESGEVNKSALAAEKLKELAISVQVKLGSFKNDEKEDQDYLEFVMENPFPSFELDDLKLVFIKQNNTDARGFKVIDVKGEKNKGMFEFRAKPYMKINEALTLSGLVTYRRFKGNNYVNIEINNPFDFGDKVMRMHIKKPGVQAVFDELASRVLELVQIK